MTVERWQGTVEAPFKGDGRAAARQRKKVLINHMLYHHVMRDKKRAARAARREGGIARQPASVRQVLIEVAMVRITWK